MTGETASSDELDSFSLSPRRALVAALVVGFVWLIGVSLFVTMGRTVPDADDLAVSVGGPLMFTLVEIGDSAWRRRRSSCHGESTSSHRPATWRRTFGAGRRASL